MRTNAALAVFALALALSGCASTGIPLVTPPDDTADSFVQRYWFLIDGKTQKAYKKLTSGQEREAFVTQFWKDRDPDPNTPENEAKTEFDQRIQDIENEALSQEPNQMAGVRFETNAGYHGDMALVYLLHGKATSFYKLENGRRIVDLVLWLYVDDQGREKFRFLFYRKGNNGEYRLFRTQVEQFGSNAFNEISIMPDIAAFDQHQMTQAEWEVYYELRNSPEVEIFRAVFQFSEYISLRVDQAVNPPKAMAFLDRKSGSNVLGQAESKPEQTFKYSRFASKIPGSATVELGGAPDDTHYPETVVVRVQYGDLDWLVKDDQLVSNLKVSVFLASKSLKAPVYFETAFPFTLAAEKFDKNPRLPVGLRLRIVRSTPGLDLLPAGKYTADIYLRNLDTQKYGTWRVEFTK